MIGKLGFSALFLGLSVTSSAFAANVAVTGTIQA